MKVLWLSPWLRPLARVQLDALAGLGVQSLLVTSDRHPEAGPARADEIVLEPSPRQPGSYPAFVRAFAAARAFAPDVVVAEMVYDPRWLAFARLAPVVHSVHDDQPHDASEIRPARDRALARRWLARADDVVVFSSFVADMLAARGTRASVVPLTSDLDPSRVPPVVPAAGRRDVVLFGRLLPYKNVPVALAAWARHVDGPGYRGDLLRLIGAGAVGPLPPHTVHDDAPFRYADVVAVLAAAKASVVHYRQASQSGAQVLSMQLGVTPIASPRGELFGMQPPGAPVVDVDDAVGLATAFDVMADPRLAATAGRAAREHYEREFSAGRAAAAWRVVLERAAARRGPPTT